MGWFENWGRFHRLASMKKMKNATMAGVSYPEMMSRRYTKLKTPFHVVKGTVVVDPPGGVEAARQRAGIRTGSQFPPVYLPGQAPWDV